MPAKPKSTPKQSNSTSQPSSEEKPKRIGRPPIQLDPKQGYTCGYFRATHETMAELFGVNVDTVRKAMRDENDPFSQAYKKGFSTMKMKLSEAQIHAALNGNASLLIWLGKQYLGQSDTPLEETDKDELPIDFSGWDVKTKKDK